VRIPIFINGSIETPERIKELFESSGCDGIMIGRGAIDNPWIFRQAKHFMRTGLRAPENSVTERFDVLLEHLRLSVEFKGERKAILEFRKYYSGYFKGLPHSSKVRQELMQFLEFAPVRDRVLAYADFLASNPSAEVLEPLPSHG
jgi:tRNA-dihydrouridine synthase